MAKNSLAQGASPVVNSAVQHIAIIMDGNGRWAGARLLPRAMGHRAGANVLRGIIEHVILLKIPFLTVFAFSSENWKRPKEEVDFLMKLFYDMLNKESEHFMDQKVRLVIAGDISAFSEPLKNKIDEIELLTQANQGLCLTIAANYGGRWDILQAMKQLIVQKIDISDVSEKILAGHLALAHTPDPDLLIRTGGDHRISNFLLWQFAYTELFFLDKNWPDFTKKDLQQVLDSFTKRERRFGGLINESKSPSSPTLTENTTSC